MFVKINYLISTVAPASSNLALISLASSGFTPSFNGLGAPSTKSLASFKPKPVISRTSLSTGILFAPAEAKITLTSEGASPASRYAEFFFHCFN